MSDETSLTHARIARNVPEFAKGMTDGRTANYFEEEEEEQLYFGEATPATKSNFRGSDVTLESDHQRLSGRVMSL